MFTNKPSQVRNFREVRVISPSPAQLEKGKQLKSKGIMNQIFGVIVIILACIIGFFSLDYGGLEFSLSIIFLGIFLGATIFSNGQKTEDAGKLLFEDILIPSDFSGMN